MPHVAAAFSFHCEDFSPLPMLCLIDGLIYNKITLRQTHTCAHVHTPIPQPGGVLGVLFFSERGQRSVETT